MSRQIGRTLTGNGMRAALHGALVGREMRRGDFLALDDLGVSYKPAPQDTDVEDSKRLPSSKAA